MAHKHENTVREALALLSATSKGLEAILSHPELATVKRRTIAQLAKSGQALQQLTGVLVSNPNGQNIRDIMATIKPLNSIGGVPLERINPVDPSDLDLSTSDKEIFTRNRDLLQARFLEMTSDDLFAFARQPQGEAMIRSIARLAGHPGYRIAELTDTFIGEIKERMREISRLETIVVNTELQGEAAIDNPDLDDDADDDDELLGSGGPAYGDMLSGLQISPGADKILPPGTPLQIKVDMIEDPIPGTTPAAEAPKVPIPPATPRSSKKP